MKQEKTIKFILELIKRTKNDEITWSSLAPGNNELPGGEFIIDKIYMCSINDNNLNLYKYKYKYWQDEYSYEWLIAYRLEKLDIGYNVDYEFEYVHSMSDLYNIVREQSSGVDEFVDNILEFKLEVIEAIYYTSQKKIDVSEKITKMIRNNKLNVLVSNDIGGDPDVGMVKRLKIKYKYEGEIHEKDNYEGQRIIIP